MSKRSICNLRKRFFLKYDEVKIERLKNIGKIPKILKGRE